jgi:hypothetical protein
VGPYKEVHGGGHDNNTPGIIASPAGPIHCLVYMGRGALIKISSYQDVHRDIPPAGTPPHCEK